MSNESLEILSEIFKEKSSHLFKGKINFHFLLWL